MVEKPDKDAGFDLRVELQKACAEAIRRGMADPATDFYTMTGGLPFGVPGTTNVLRVVSAAGPDHWFDVDGELKLYDKETNMD